MSGVNDNYADAIAELRRMQDRLRTLRGGLCATANNQNVRYHAFSAAIAQLNRAIADLEDEESDATTAPAP